MFSNKKQLELKKAAEMYVQRASVKKGETIIITTDSSSDRSLVDAVFNATNDVEALPIEIKVPYREGENSIRVAPLCVEEAMKNADVLLAIKGYASYEDSYREVLENTRVLGLKNPSADTFINDLLNIDYETIDKISDILTDLLTDTSEFKITSTGGTDVKMTLGNRHVASDPGKVSVKRDEQFLPGACVCVAPIEESWEGTIVFDALVWPPIGTLSSPITLEVREGIAETIEGGEDAKTFRQWLESFDDPNMFRMCHNDIGINPQYNELTGNKGHDERIFGIVGCGLGTNNIPVFEGTIRAKAHTDGYMRCASVYFDGTPIIERGRFVHPSLKDIHDAEFCMDCL